MEEALFLIVVLLGLILFVALRVQSKISSIARDASSSLHVLNATHNYLVTAHNEQSEQINHALEGIVIDVASVKFDIHEIKYVTDTIYKYKLPNSAQQKILDQIEIDSEQDQSR